MKRTGGTSEQSSNPGRFRGRVRYFGDAKAKDLPDPRSATVNKDLIALFEQQSSPDVDVRAKACPIAFFVTTKPGEVEFRGIGIIEAVELVSQVDPKSGLAFSNYAFDCALISLATEGECLDWDWITERRDPTLSATETLRTAPASWRTWVNEGSESLGRVRRVVARLGVTNKEEQLPDRSSAEEAVLQEIYDFYSSDGNRRKARFEALAELVTDYVISEDGSGKYQQGWITRGTGDHVIDFVGRLDVGTGFSSTSLVVLGQAKCEHPSSTTSGKDIARTVARLKRGWIGCYVTTATFSTSTQQEVIEDKYPLVMVPGGEVARIVRKIAIDDGIDGCEGDPVVGPGAMRLGVGWWFSTWRRTRLG